ncbi:TldD/PmbA family protein [Myxococcus sp. K15C18031901]|uniref:TldD/PmbA family protein n=1 Tax=Myxococcus dinghuensis TaxID=2906761 RepID=UPI0020A75714|nr:TldD/PmbA family protein [Myxococcus dinghuensis]MCP3101743.1 TldD/PmbA family protein [Myxococcus dinghuensis]
MAAAPAQDPRLLLLDAMASELTRSQQQLKLQTHEAPYFLSYQLKDYDQQVIAARYGAIFLDDGYRERRLYVDSRVGSYDFDSSVAEGLEFSFSTKGTSYTSRKEGPLDDSPLALRTALWLITDEKYKSALFQYLKKKGEDVYSVEDPKRPPSFTKEKSTTFVQPPVTNPFNRERWLKLARDISAQFNAHPELFDSEVRITADKVTRLFVSTEGTQLVTEETLYGLHVSAVTRAPDGQLLDDSRDFYAPTEAGLPDDTRVRESAAKVIEELLALRQAPAIDPYTGPAILAPEASGVLFHEAVGHRLEGDRQDGDNEGKTFKGQVGRQVLPSFLTIVDDPTQRALAGEPLNGYYLFDEEGVKGQRVALVEKGVLRNYLLGRRPVEGFLQSNGHGRSQGNLKPVARMANLIVESTKQVSDAKLKQMLIDEAKRQGKPYGLIIRDITGGNTNTSNYGYQAFKGVPRMVYRVDVKTGQESLVRGVEIVGTPLSAVNRILATGQKQGIFNGFCGAESGNVPVSTVAPAALLQEIELQRAVEGKDRPPILSSPAAAQAPAVQEKP